MRSWRCRFSAHRESKRTAFRLLQHNEKSSVPLNEACTPRIVVAMSRALHARLRKSDALTRHVGATNRSHIQKLQKARLNKAFLHARYFCPDAIDSQTGTPT